MVWLAEMFPHELLAGKTFVFRLQVLTVWLGRSPSTRAVRLMVLDEC